MLLLGRKIKRAYYVGFYEIEVQIHVKPYFKNNIVLPTQSCESTDFVVSGKKNNIILLSSIKMEKNSNKVTLDDKKTCLGLHQCF